MIDRETFGRRLKEQRKLRGLSQPELADAAGIENWNRISNWELGYNFPPLNVLCRLAVALNCSVDYLVGIDEQVLNAEELWCLERYRELDEAGRELIRVVLETQARRLSVLTPEE